MKEESKCEKAVCWERLIITECQGVNSIVGNLEKQDLDEVNEELRAMNLLESTVPLPRYAGGGEVGA